MNHYALAIELVERLAEHVPADDPFLASAKRALSRPTSGQFKTGESNPVAVLTPHDVRQMRKMRADGLTYEQLAVRYGMSAKQMWRICNRKQWSWVE
jgi:hypothetical protein